MVIHIFRYQCVSGGRIFRHFCGYVINGVFNIQLKLLDKRGRNLVSLSKYG